MTGRGISQAAAEAKVAAEAKAKTEAEAKAAAEKAAAEAKVAIHTRVRRGPCLCSKSTVCLREMEIPSFLIFRNKEASLHPV